MGKRDFKSVNEYIAAQPEASRGILKRVRSAICAAVPKAEEMISYKIPAYKLQGQPVLYFAGWKQHYSLYPAPPEVVAAFQDELAQYEIRKGTIRLPLTDPVPVKLIARIAKFRAARIVAQEKKAVKAPKKR